MKLNKPNKHLTLDQPIYVGCAVLELSIWLMYDFHYKFIKKKFDANSYILLIHTVLLNQIKRCL